MGRSALQLYVACAETRASAGRTSGSTPGLQTARPLPIRRMRIPAGGFQASARCRPDRRETARGASTLVGMVLPGRPLAHQFQSSLPRGASGAPYHVSIVAGRAIGLIFQGKWHLSRRRAPRLPVLLRKRNVLHMLDMVRMAHMRFTAGRFGRASPRLCGSQTGCGPIVQRELPLFLPSRLQAESPTRDAGFVKRVTHVPHGARGAHSIHNGRFERASLRTHGRRTGCRPNLQRQEPLVPPSRLEAKNPSQDAGRVTHVTHLTHGSQIIHGAHEPHEKHEALATDLAHVSGGNQICRKTSGRLPGARSVIQVSGETYHSRYV